RARSQVAVGDYIAAEKDFRRAMDLTAASAGSGTHMDAVCDLASLLDELGRAREAQQLWDGLIELYRTGQVKGSRQLGDIAVAAWHRGYIQDAKDIFIDATSDKQTGEISLESLTDFGYLFLEKYKPSDALGVFRDCLKINKTYPEALLGVALAKKYEGSAEVEVNVKAALAVNPNLVPALDLLAELRMQEEDYDAADRDIRKALAVNPASLASLSLEAVGRLFRGDMTGFAADEKKILAINPSYGQLYYTVAESLVSRRKYQEAVDFDRKAVALDPKLWSAWASLGMNLTRVGDLAEGRKAIEKAFEGDPFNIWAYNSLELLDAMDKFERVQSEHFVYRMSKEDEPVLFPYAPKLAEEAYTKLTERYGFVPKGTIEVEIFPDHEGFAVRTLGLPGLGALGVCFGKVVAIDSPRARPEGAFNWGSTLWHEFTHVITLQMTNHNIPRWYSEGLSVYEERRARPGWGDDLTAMIVRFYKAGKLLKVSELNAGMMRPQSPHQIALAYWQASLVCELIEEKFGFEKIKQSLRLFAENDSTEEVFKRTLGWDAATLDSEYSRFLEARLKGVAQRLDFSPFAAPAKEGSSQLPREQGRKELAELLSKNPDDFFANLQMGLLLHNQKADSEAEPYLKKAEQLFPEFAEEMNPYLVLGDMYLEQNRDDEALAQFLGWSGHNENAVVPLVRAAEIYRRKRDWSSAARELELSVYINPYDAGVLARLGADAKECGAWPSAVAAYQALLGLNPTDPADAHCSLAGALLGAGKRQEAKKETLRALELAPTYVKAQELLLKLSGETP
ncbi:MAG TPA: hypothetical protein VE398_16750, partial [Acidobacteriota bacterium]|nr:hypothetical protein [Acidobacteriota bacterium]